MRRSGMGLGGMIALGMAAAASLELPGDRVAQRAPVKGNPPSGPVTETRQMRRARERAECKASGARR